MEHEKKSIEEVFEANVRRCYWAVNHYCKEHNIGKDSIREDLIQEVFLAYWKWLRASEAHLYEDRFPWMDMYHACYAFTVKNHPLTIPREKFKAVAGQTKIIAGGADMWDSADETAAHAFFEAEWMADLAAKMKGRLTEKEGAVLEMLLLWMPKQDIAKRLNITPAMVSIYLKRLRRKIDPSIFICHDY